MSTSFKNWAGQWLTIGVDSADKDKLAKIKLVNGFIFVGVVVFSLFSFVNYSQGNLLGGLIEFFMAVVLVANYLFLYKTRNLSNAINVVILCLATILVYLILSGGIQGTGIIWLTVYPLVVYFLKGRRSGTWWLVAFLIVLLGVWVLSSVTGIKSPYDHVTMRQVIISFFVTATLVYFYETTKYDLHKELEVQQVELAHANTQLKEQINDRQRQEKKVKSSLDEVAVKNQSLEDTKQAMLNLLEDARDLENKLMVERDRAAAIISSMGEGLLVLNEKYEIVQMNPAAEKLLETSVAEAVGKPWSTFTKAYHGDKLLSFEKRSAVKVLAEKKVIFTSVDDDHYYETRTGKRFAVGSITAPLTTGGKVTGVVKVFRDITHEKEEKKIIERTVQERTKELREAKDKISEGLQLLQKEKARLMAAIQGLPRGFILTDVAGNILITNNLLEKIIGKADTSWTLEEVQDRLSGYLDIKHLFEECTREKRPMGVKNIQFVSRILDVYITPVFTDPESIIGTMVLFEDVTEAKILERSKDEFFSIASHELRTPLTAIRGNTSMILDYYSEKFKDPELREMIEDVHTSSIRLIEIVNDFLNMSRLEQRKIVLAKETFLIEDLINEVVRELENQAREKKIILEYKKPTGSPVVILADRNRAKEAIINIVGNAIKFTEKGSVTVLTTAKDGFGEVTVTDTGRGISYKNQNLLFRKFQQAGDSLYTRDTTRGTGLGLYISKLMIEAMGGKIYLVKSIEGQGSTFSFTLPLAGKSQEEAHAKPQA